MLVEIYTVTWNNQERLLDFIEWYKERLPNVIINVWDNMSTDNTQQICINEGVNYIPFDTEGKMDEKTLINIRNSCWVDSKADIIIVCDDDEWIDVTPEKLEQIGDYSVCKGYEIFGSEEKISKEKLLKPLMGVEAIGYSKPVVFNKHTIESMNFEAGSHSANPTIKENREIVKTENILDLYHTKWRSWEEGIQRLC